MVSISRPSQSFSTHDTPTWFLIWLIEQLGGSLVLDGNEIISIQENNKDKEIRWWNDDRGRFLIEVGSR